MARRRGPAVEAPAAAPAARRADDSLNATAWYQTALERDLVYRTCIAPPAQRCRPRCRQGLGCAAEGRPHADARRLKPAIIVDVDETVLDNAPSTVRRSGAARVQRSAWGQVGLERKAKPLAGSVEFLDAARSRASPFLHHQSRREPGRRHHRQPAQRRLPGAQDTQCSGSAPSSMGASRKGRRSRAVASWSERSHRVLMQFGDQVGDFVQIQANTPRGPRAAARPIRTGSASVGSCCRTRCTGPGSRRCSTTNGASRSRAPRREGSRARRRQVINRLRDIIQVLHQLRPLG
jgi:acid phosphatase